LRAAEATFSAVLQRTRVEAAVALIQTSELGLAEVAFCTGFSDHAHLTRTTRKLLDVPPSSLRTLLNTIG
ncbi:MAG: helix-turn-helix domain-containing protein, partial [Nannocystaceae bacterium]|nr:helix-turn-helix domain-containing protein [Nannocystaceae bacterium]